MQNLSEIIHSQTKLKGIDKDINRLRKVQSVWLEIINTPSNGSQNFNPAILEKSIPLRVYDNTVSIACETPLLANHLRFNKDTLLQLLITKGLKDIEFISISVSQDTGNSNQTYKKKQKIKRVVDSTTITNLEQFLNSCSSEQLSLSIKKLLDRLKSPS